MKRELGPWVWCRYCARNVWHRCVVEWAKEAGCCTPRLTLSARVRRALGLPIGEEPE